MKELGAFKSYIMDHQEHIAHMEMAEELPTSVLIATLRKRLGAEEYLENNAALEKLSWEIEVLGKDAKNG